MTLTFDPIQVDADTDVLTGEKDETRSVPSSANFHET